METQCSCSSSLALKGQGCFILWVTFTCLLSLGACQLSPDSSHTILPSKTAWTTPSASTAGSQPASFAPDVASSSQSLARDPSSSVLNSDSSANYTRGGISPTSPVRDSSPTASDSVVGTDGGLLPSHTIVADGETLQSSSFLPPRVSVYRTATEPLDLDSSEFGVTNTFGTAWEYATSGSLDDATFSLSLQSTAFVDSVASSIRRDPTEGPQEFSAFVSHVQLSTQPVSGTTLFSTEHEDSGSTFSSIELTSGVGSLTQSPEDSIFLTSGQEVEATSSPSLPESSVTGMWDMNSTQTFTTITEPSTGETTTFLLTSTPEVSSPGPSGGNGSCTEKDTGCVEYRGDDDAEEEELRIKIIVGAVCGGLLLIVIVAIFIGCLLRRRGKMPSGSKIDLSSYWDDSVTLSYINGHVDIPKDSADEMISLDNDSFLNSLDSMSFTNTWTSDTSKHTNF